MVNITFSNPQFLWLLLGIPVLILSHIVFIRNAKHKGLRFANFEAMRRISGETFLTKNISHLVLRCLIIFFLVLAVSGATITYETLASENSVVFMLDSSPSMSTQDFDPNRFEFSRGFIREMVEAIDFNIRYGLLSYGGISKIHQLPTDSRMELRNSLREPELIQAGGTDLSSAVVNAVNMLSLEEPGRGKVVVLVSDGVETTSAFLGNPLQQAVNYANTNNVVIHAVGVGSESDAPVGFLPEYYNISNWYMPDNLRFLTEETGGVFIEVNDPGALNQTVSRMGGELQRSNIPYDLTFGALLLVILIIFIEWGLANTIYRRIA